MRSAIPLRIVCQAALMAGMTLIPRSAYAYDYIKNGGFEDGCTPDTQDCKYWYFTGNAGVNKVPHSDNTARMLEEKVMVRERCISRSS